MSARWIVRWIAVVGAGSGITAAVYALLLGAAVGLSPGDLPAATMHQWIGQAVGILVNMPFMWMASDGAGRKRLSALWRLPETVAYSLLAVAIFAAGIQGGLMAKLHLFYLLLLPIIWAGTRQGTAGAAYAVFAVQAGLIVELRNMARSLDDLYELQVLVGLFAFVGLFVGLVVDEQWRTTRKLKQTLHLAAAGELTAALAHELVQPLTALAAYGSVIRVLAERGESGAKLKEPIDLMVGEAHRAGDVVRKLREFFLTGTASTQPLDAIDVIRKVARGFEARAAGAGASFEVLPGESPKVLADPTHLGMIVRNLLANAFDAVEGRSAGRRVTVATGPVSGGRLRIVVEDSGPGISSDTAARIFESFYSTKSSGLGLGLVMSRTLAEAHGGRLWAEIDDHGVFVLELRIDEGRSNG